MLNPFAPYRPFPKKLLFLLCFIPLALYVGWVEWRDEWGYPTIGFRTIAQDVSGGEPFYPDCSLVSPTIHVLSDADQGMGGLQIRDGRSQVIAFESEIVLIVLNGCSAPHPAAKLNVYRITNLPGNGIRLHAEQGKIPPDSAVPAMISVPFHAIAIERALFQDKGRRVYLRINGEDVWSGLVKVD